MCGILFSLASENHSIDNEEWETLKELNKRRGKLLLYWILFKGVSCSSFILGPDCQNLHRLTTRGISQQNVHLQFYSTVLHLRGPEPVLQPRVNALSGNTLCWNGEIFGGLNVSALCPCSR